MVSAACKATGAGGVSLNKQTSGWWCRETFCSQRVPSLKIVLTAAAALAPHKFLFLPYFTAKKRKEKKRKGKKTQWHIWQLLFFSRSYEMLTQPLHTYPRTPTTPSPNKKGSASHLRTLPVKTWSRHCCLASVLTETLMRQCSPVPVLPPRRCQSIRR